MLKNFNSEIKTFLIVAIIAIVITVAGILLLKAIQPSPIVQQTPPPAPQPQSIDTSTRYTDYRSDQQKVTEYLRENITDMVRSNLVLRMPRLFIPKVEFYEGNKVIATFIDDNRVVGYLLGKYSVEDGKVQVMYLGETLNGKGEESLDELKQKYEFIELDTSDWQTYRNKEYGFEFLRPDLDFIHISVVRKNVSFDKFVEKAAGTLLRGYKEVTVAGVSAVQGVQSVGGESGAFRIATYIDLTPTEIIMLGTYTGPEDDEKYKERLQQHEKTLSTFRLIDPNDLSFLENSFSAWGTYEGRLDLEIPRDYTRRDFKFEYPLNWVIYEVSNDVFISTFEDGYARAIYSQFLEISSDQGLAVISVKPRDKNPAYSLDEWIDNTPEPNDDYVVLERSVIPGIEHENRLIRYEVPKLGVEGRDAYVVRTEYRITRWSGPPEVVFMFHLEYNQADQMANIYEKVFDQILATFRFVGSSSKFGVPTTYEECAKMDKSYMNEVTGLECRYTVFYSDNDETNKADYLECQKIGGIETVSGGELNPPVYAYMCDLNFYNSNYEFPKTFEECKKSKPEWLRVSIGSQERCNVAIENITHHNKDVANGLMDKCIDLGGNYTEYPNRFARTQCVIWYEK